MALFFHHLFAFPVQSCFSLRNIHLYCMKDFSYLHCKVLCSILEEYGISKMVLWVMGKSSTGSLVVYLSKTVVLCLASLWLD